ncbi:MAG: hypothetical protein GVY18_06975 [Bacteroidetes bacterium]|jgi:hypothetical protein|nr:hypothetical protein [Bacteroidota bacterium]
MTQLLETAFERASRLPEQVQDALAEELLTRIEAEEAAQSPEAEEPFISAYDVSKHLAGSIKGGPSDLATNKNYLEGLGERSMG